MKEVILTAWKIGSYIIVFVHIYLITMGILMVSDLLLAYEGKPIRGIGFVFLMLISSGIITNKLMRE